MWHVSSGFDAHVVLPGVASKLVFRVAWWWLVSELGLFGTAWLRVFCGCYNMLSDGFCWWFPGGCWLVLIWVWVWFVILGLMVAGSGFRGVVWWFPGRAGFAC